MVKFALNRFPLWKQIVIASIAGVIFASINQKWGVQVKIVVDLFIKFIQVTIVPLVFPLIVLGIAQLHSGKAVGKMAVKGILYFEIVTTLLLVMSVSLVHLFGTGVGANLKGENAAFLTGMADKGLSFSQFLLSIVPNNIVQAMSQGHILPVLFFGVLFGLALGAIGEKGKPIILLLESLKSAMFKFVDYVIATSPFGVFGFVAFSVANYGLSKITSLLDLILVVYVGLLITLFVVFPTIAKIFKIPYFQILNSIKDLILIVASTRSSESVLSPAMERLEGMGVKNTAVSFMMPLGYSFNLDGGSVYWAPAILFVANAFNVPLTLLDQIQLVITLMLISKGIAGVTGSNFVVLTIVATMFGLPLEGVALLFAVDWITDIGRSTVNMVGNVLATVVIAKSEGFYPCPDSSSEMAMSTTEAGVAVK